MHFSVMKIQFQAFLKILKGIMRKEVDIMHTVKVWDFLFFFSNNAMFYQKQFCYCKKLVPGQLKHNMELYRFLIFKLIYKHKCDRKRICKMRDLESFYLNFWLADMSSC